MRLLLVLPFVAFTALSANAQQGPQCAPHDLIVKGLLDQYHEVRQSIGLVSDKGMVESFVSPSGTWTWVLTNQDRMSCILLAGDNWEFDTTALDKAKKGEAM